MSMPTPEPLSMLELNWLPALYAHPAHWGALAHLRPAQPARSQRIVLRVSAALVAQARLAAQHAAHAPGWLRLQAAPFCALAQRLGQVALAERVRHALDRRAVLLSIELLGPRVREQAYDDARSWPALGVLVGAAEPLPADREALAAVGGCVMAALLEPEQSGLGERLRLRFGPGLVSPRALGAAARTEAQAFLQAGCA